MAPSSIMDAANSGMRRSVASMTGCTSVSRRTQAPRAASRAPTSAARATVVRPRAAKVARLAERGQPAPRALLMRMEAAIDTPNTTMKLQNARV